MNEGYVHQNLLDKRKKIKPKFKLRDLVKTADKKNIFAKSDTLNWSDKLYKKTEIIEDQYQLITCIINLKDIMKHC